MKSQGISIFFLISYSVAGKLSVGYLSIVLDRAGPSPKRSIKDSERVNSNLSEGWLDPPLGDDASLTILTFVTCAFSLTTALCRI